MQLTRKQIRDRKQAIKYLLLGIVIGFVMFFAGMYIGVNFGFDLAELRYRDAFIQLKRQMIQQQQQTPEDYWQEYMNRLA